MKWCLLESSPCRSKLFDTTAKINHLRKLSFVFINIAGEPLFIFYITEILLCRVSQIRKFGITGMWGIPKRIFYAQTKIILWYWNWKFGTKRVMTLFTLKTHSSSILLPSSSSISKVYLCTKYEYYNKTRINFNFDFVKNMSCTFDSIRLPSLLQFVLSYWHATNTILVLYCYCYSITMHKYM